MAIVAMADAVPGAIASSVEYNKLIDNIYDLDARLGAVVASPSAHTRLTSLETLTTDTATNGGQGNARLADRFGTGVGTGSNVTTGSASSQLGDLRTRATALEGVTQHATSGNSALSTRVTTAQAKADLAYNALPNATKYALGSAATINSATPVTFFSQSVSVTSATNQLVIIGNLDCSISGTLTGVNPGSGAGVLAVELLVDGVAQSAQIIFGTTVATRGSSGQSWVLNNLSVGSHTLALRGGISGAPSPYPTYQCWNLHTGLTVAIVNK